MPTGSVVGIMKRNWRPYPPFPPLMSFSDKFFSNKIRYVGSLEPDSKISDKEQSLLFVAIDPVIPKIRIKTRQADTLFDKRIVVSIDRWDRTSKFPSGHYVKTLGNTPTTHPHPHTHAYSPSQVKLAIGMWRVRHC